MKTRKYFDTRVEARAFREGIEFVGDESISADGPFTNDDEPDQPPFFLLIEDDEADR